MRPKKLFASILAGLVSALLVAALINQQRQTSLLESETTDQEPRVTVTKTNSANETTQPVQSEEVRGNINDVLNTDQPLTCTFEQKQDDHKTTSILYTADARYRLVIPVQETDSTIHMINDGQAFYTWNDKNQSGTKQQPQIPEDGQQEENLSGKPEELEDIEQEQYTFTCNSWVPDESLFSPPNEITFTDVTE